MLARVRRTITGRRLLERGQHVVVACSGGADSVALTALLARLAPELGVTLLVASVDHGLRPEAREEVERVGRLADSLGLPFRPLRVSVDYTASGLQASARDARYRALRELAEGAGAPRVAVGHTQDDQAETVLDRMLRGAGLRGASGIAPRRRDGVVRPLIDCRRSDLREWVRGEGLWFVDDPTNADPRFGRVRLRHEVLPVLVREDPQVVPHLAALADDARAAARVLGSRGRRALIRAGWPEGAPRASVLAGAPAAVRRVALRRWAEDLTGVSPRRRQVEALERLLAGTGEVLLGDGWGARIEEGRLVARRDPHRPTRSTRKHD